ncbi:GNAT family N-acetyltransferase [Cellulomonas edaphi]|uniref:GNAT family N-acetyltransferase n=1 Tax=Cellulomonas edaphi TaxID=3053468 RepID=A0ABT7SA43_9CELL|nr:GNAT family N-acetyltransferase [Cellulomons edaphi]MDM7832500.1 GNAT family N-acetyltransferase [Cellulomons edaphi]
MGDLDLGPSQYIAALALVASAVSLVLSWRAGRRTARITTYRSATDLVLDIDRIFISNPQLRPYFYDGVDVDDQADDSNQIAAVAEFMLDCYECIWDIRGTFSPEDRRSWGCFVLDMLDASPSLTRMYGERSVQDWYPALDNLMAAERSGQLRPAASPTAAVPMAPEADLELVPLGAATARQVWEFHDALLARTFPADELESFEELARSLGDGTGGTLALDDGRVVGGVVDERYNDARVRLLSYLVVDPSTRGHGLGARLVHLSVAGAQGALVVGEIEDPRRWPTTATSDPAARVRFWARLGCRVLPLPYVQPRLAPGGDRVRHLLLVVIPPEGDAAPESVPGPTVAAFLREYFCVTEGVEPEDDEYRGLVDRCAVPSLRLWPLDELDAALPLEQESGLEHRAG